MMITAVWCYWCQIMKDDSYIDADVVKFIQENYIPMLVDNDHRPDINFRYNVGGWPTTAVLTPHGGIIAGATYLTPDQLLSMLIEVHAAYVEDKPGLYDRARELFLARQTRSSRVGIKTVSQNPESSTLTMLLVDSIARMSMGTYDPINGGFGFEPKFPNPAVLNLMLHLYKVTQEPFYRLIVEKTLNSIATSRMFDELEGGFFRYSKTSDWNFPQYEKILEDNVNLAKIFLDAGQYLKIQTLTDAGVKTLDFISRDLFDPESLGFKGSKGADSSYFELDRQERTQQDPPDTDLWCYVSSSARALGLFVEYSEILDATLIDFNVSLDNLVLKLTNSHSFTAIASDKTPTMLIDFGEVINTLVVTQQNQNSLCKDYSLSIQSLITAAIDTLYDHNSGGFYDTSKTEDSIGYLTIKEKPLPDNLSIIRAIIRYCDCYQDFQYLPLIEQTLLAFLDVYQEYGEDSAEYGYLIALYLELKTSSNTAN